MDNKDLFNYDKNILKQYQSILGIDEVGRGCVCGPLVVAGVILKKDYYNKNVVDSKKIKSIKTRKIIADDIIKNCITYEYVVYNPDQIDLLNPKQASIKGMEIIANKLKDQYEIVITDYEKLNLDNIKQINLKHGDSISYSVACASIIAKHIRDNIMIELNSKYPQYDLINNQGYLTKKHYQLLNQYGVVKEIYRCSYKPIKELLKTNNNK